MTKGPGALNYPFRLPGNKKDGNSSDSGTGIAVFFALTPPSDWPIYRRTQVLKLAGRAIFSRAPEQYIGTGKAAKVYRSAWPTILFTKFDALPDSSRPAGSGIFP